MPSSPDSPASRPTPDPSTPSTGWHPRLKPGDPPSLSPLSSNDPTAAALRAAFPSSPHHSTGHSLRVPGYDLLTELGAGGMGVVYLARQHDPDRPVALKVLRAGAFAGEAAHARLAEEARIVERLRHRDIVQLYEYGEVDGLPYLVLEYVPGPTLAKLAGGKPQDPRGAARVMERIARAVQYAHEQGVVHRDLKPANVLLQNDDRRPGDGGTVSDPGFDLRLSSVRPKITDFGLAKAVGETQIQTATGMAAGTPGYMAPEQATGDKTRLGPWTDVFALGVMLYELLTGKLPYRGDSPAALLFAPMAGKPVPFREYRKGLPADLERVCLKCLTSEPRDRYLTAAALADDLQRFLDGRSVAAQITASAPGWKDVVRKPATAGLAAALLGVLGGGLAVTTALYLRASRAHQEADLQRAEAEVAREAARKRDDDATRAGAAVTLPSVKFDDLEHVLTERVADSEKKAGPNDPGAITALLALADLYMLAKRPDKAEPVATAAAARAEAAAAGRPSELLARTLAVKADAIAADQPRVKWARGEAAEKAGRQAVMAALAAYPPGHEKLFDRVTALTAVLAAVRGPAAAEEFAREAVANSQARLGPTSPMVQKLSDHLATVIARPPDPAAVPAVIPRGD